MSHEDRRLAGGPDSQWKAAAYARLSREDGDNRTSGSIQNQLQIIRDFAARRGEVEIVETYVDDGYSGTTFDRPSFKRMMEDARHGRFDTIIVKDQSRFGRDYLGVGEWVERKLPALGVRLYAIADDFDSSRPRDYNAALLFPIKNITNELYAWTTSEKTRASLAARRRQGICVASFTPYGYRKDPEDKGRLVVDKDVAGVVRRMFRWRDEGLSLGEIARRLSEEGAPTPLQRKRALGSLISCPFGDTSSAPLEVRWYPMQVARILRNEVYVGTLVQGRTGRTVWGMHRSQALPSEDWVRVPHAHAAIVSPALFERVQRSFVAEVGERT